MIIKDKDVTDTDVGPEMSIADTDTNYVSLVQLTGFTITTR